MKLTYALPLGTSNGDMQRKLSFLIQCICRVTALAFQNNFFVIFKMFSISLLLLTVRSSKTAIMFL